MAILVDPVIEYDPSTQPPPGVTGTSWCHCVSDTSLAELQVFLDGNQQIGQPSSNIRTPALGSNVTYVGLDQAMRDAAVAAGALERSGAACFAHDYNSPPSHRGTYEP